MERIAVRKADVRGIVEAAAPGYRGRTFHVIPTDSVTIHGTYWDGGSRSYWSAVRLVDGKASNLPTLTPWDNMAEGATVEVPEGVVIVERVIFQGKDLGIRIYANPANLPALLPPTSARR